LKTQKPMQAVARHLRDWTHPLPAVS